MTWQIQARPKVADGTAEWEPITLERAKLVSGLYQRRYQYETLEEAEQAFGEYVEVEGGLPNLLVRMATGRERFTDTYEVRFVEFWVKDEAQSALRDTNQHVKMLQDAYDRLRLESWNLRGELDAANQHVKILEADRNSAIAACLRSCARTIHANCLHSVEASNYLTSYADSVQTNYTTPTPASGPGGFAAVSPDSESALREKHPYYSTACMHALHDRCRLSCKFCASPCMCACHQRNSEKPGA